MGISHIVETHGNGADVLLGTCLITHQFNGTRILPKTTSAPATDWVNLPMTTLTLLNGKALALNKVEVRFYLGSAATVNKIYLWKGDQAPFATVDVNRTISGNTSIPFTVPNTILGQGIGLSMEVTLQANGYLVLSGAGLFLSETAFGLDKVATKDEPEGESLEAVLTLTDAT